MPIVLSFLLLLILIFGVLPAVLIPFILYRILLVRTSVKKWQRVCSEPKNKEQVEMYRRGEAWAEKNAASMSEVSIQSKGFHLAGEYFDFGSDKAVIILSGRTEGCRYSCYFAAPYQNCGFNVLVIDNRAHGLSEGKYNTVGYLEYEDVLSWIHFLEEKGNQTIIAHGICIGAATALYAALDARCPSSFKGLVADGMFTTFRESFDNHLIADKRPRFPTVQIFIGLLSLRAHCNAFKIGPETCIDRYQKPILFLYSKEDRFSTPENAKKVFSLCASKEKKLVWFEKGVHSHLRINAEEAYDAAIISYLKEVHLA